jgi:hypothetical protein
MEDIYNENGLKPTVYSESATPTRYVDDEDDDLVLFFDLDRELTLFDCITKIRSRLNTITRDHILTLVFIKGVREYNDLCFDGALLWQYLSDSGYTYNVVFRGYSPTIMESCFSFKCLNVYLSRHLRSVDGDSNVIDVYSKEPKYKFELI